VSGWWRGTRLVIGRELLVGFGRKSYRITLAILALGGLAVAVLPRVLSSDSKPSYTVAGVGNAPSGFDGALDAVAEALEIKVLIERVGDRDAAEAAVVDGSADAALAWPPGADRGQDHEPPTLLQDTSTAPELVAALSNAAVVSSTTQRLAALGVAPEDAARVLAAPPRSELVATPASTGQAGVGYAVVLVLYLFILLAGNQVAQGVAVEKTNRIAESLLATVRASQLLAGKVVGIGLLAVTGLLATGAPVVVSLLAGGDVDVPDGAVFQIVAGLGWFVLGFALYACAYAALGALVDRQEEIGGAVMPLTFALVGTFFLAVQAQESPESALAVVASLVPATAPMVMPMRTAVGAASAVEIVVSVLGVMLAAALLVRVGGSVYRRAMIRTGRRLKLREMLRG
jgi:ABC-2 type transport system permease protein